jgi:RNA polymerase sigma-70 factor (ECF subfamily)
VKEERQDLQPDRWVQEHGDLLFRYALVRLRDRTAAEEVVQETFLAALKGREQFKGRASERTWLVGILKHEIIDYFRKSNREIPIGDVAVSEGPSEDITFSRGRVLLGSAALV